MGSVTVDGFHEVERDGKLFLVYHHQKYHPVPAQTQSQSPPYDEVVNSDHLLQSRFLCPLVRLRFNFRTSIVSSSEYVSSTISNNLLLNHSVLPLFWCNNKEFNVDGMCGICFNSKSGTDYYFCQYCDKIFHKECVESPVKIKHPYHPEHSLQLYYLRFYDDPMECFYCGRKAIGLLYYCTICKATLHTICAMMPIPIFIDPPKKHNHTLTFFTRKASLTCNVCGLWSKIYPTYICARCNFVTHIDCMYSPHIVMISRHHHRINYISSLQSGEWTCGVCRKSIDGDYGAYSCDKCGDYVVHSRCALWKDVWDGLDLEGVPEEDDITQDVRPFDMISEGVIHHFFHDHHLQLEVSMHNDEIKLCQACALLICEGNCYSCTQCDFFIHESCANAPRIIKHPLHPHALTLKHGSGYGSGYFICNACGRNCCGFVYECHKGECTFDLDVRCALNSEPFEFKGHEHPLFLNLDPIKKPICHICKGECYKPLNCIKCDFIVCIKCATVPYIARYRHDKHFLEILCGEKVCEQDWCEVCERNLGDTDTYMFYWCKECCTTFHIECLFGKDPYMKPGQAYGSFTLPIKILSKNNISRAICNYCKNPCLNKIFKSEKGVACSVICANRLRRNIV